MPPSTDATFGPGPKWRALTTKVGGVILFFAPVFFGVTALREPFRWRFEERSLAEQGLQWIVTNNGERVDDLTVAVSGVRPSLASVDVTVPGLRGLPLKVDRRRTTPDEDPEPPPPVVAFCATDDGPKGVNPGESISIAVLAVPSSGTPSFTVSTSRGVVSRETLTRARYVAIAAGFLGLAGAVSLGAWQASRGLAQRRRRRYFRRVASLPAERQRAERFRIAAAVLRELDARLLITDDEARVAMLNSAVDRVFEEGKSGEEELDALITRLVGEELAK